MPLNNLNWIFQNKLSLPKMWSFSSSLNERGLSSFKSPAKSTFMGSTQPGSSPKGYFVHCSYSSNSRLSGFLQQFETSFPNKSSFGLFLGKSQRKLNANDSSLVFSRVFEEKNTNIFKKEKAFEKIQGKINDLEKTKAKRTLELRSKSLKSQLEGKNTKEIGPKSLSAMGALKERMEREKKQRNSIRLKMEPPSKWGSANSPLFFQGVRPKSHLKGLLNSFKMEESGAFIPKE